MNLNKANDQDSSFFQHNFAGLAFAQTVEEHVGSHHAEATIFAQRGHVIRVNLGIHGVADYVVHIGLQAKVLIQPVRNVLEVFRIKQFTRTARNGLAILQNNFLQISRESAFGLTHHALEERHNGIREVKRFALLQNVLGRQIVLHHEDSHVANRL